MKLVFNNTFTKRVTFINMSKSKEIFALKLFKQQLSSIKLDIKT